MLSHPVQGQDSHLEWSSTIIRPMPQDIKGTGSNDINELFGVLKSQFADMTVNKLALYTVRYFRAWVSTYHMPSIPTSYPHQLFNTMCSPLSYDFIFPLHCELILAPRFFIYLRLHTNVTWTDCVKKVVIKLLKVMFFCQRNPCQALFFWIIILTKLR